MRHEAVDLAYDLWSRSGTLANTVNFRAILDLPNTLYLIADCDGVGRKGSMLVRCTRNVNLAEATTKLPDVVAALYRDVTLAVTASDSIGVKF